MTRARVIVVRTSIYIDTGHDPALVRALILETLQRNSLIVIEDPDDEPAVNYFGVESINGYWVSHFSARFAIRSSVQRNAAVQELWLTLWQRFQDCGIVWRDPEPVGTIPAVARFGGARA